MGIIDFFAETIKKKKAATHGDFIAAVKSASPDDYASIPDDELAALIARKAPELGFLNTFQADAPISPATVPLKYRSSDFYDTHPDLAPDDAGKILSNFRTKYPDKADAPDAKIASFLAKKSPKDYGFMVKALTPKEEKTETTPPSAGGYSMSGTAPAPIPALTPSVSGQKFITEPVKDEPVTLKPKEPKKVDPLAKQAFDTVILDHVARMQPAGFSQLLYTDAGKRTVQNISAATLGMMSDTANFVPFAEKFIGWDTGVGDAASKVADQLDDMRNLSNPENMNVMDEAVQALTTMGIFGAAGAGVAGGVRGLAGAIPSIARLASGLGTTTMTVLESMQETGGVYNRLKGQKGAEQSAAKNFAANIALIGVTNHLQDFFNISKKAAVSMLDQVAETSKGGLLESLQEVGQYALQQNALGQPIDMNEALKVGGISFLVGGAAQGFSRLASQDTGIPGTPPQAPEMPGKPTLPPQDTRTSEPAEFTASMEKAMAESREALKKKWADKFGDVPLEVKGNPKDIEALKGAAKQIKTAEEFVTWMESPFSKSEATDKLNAQIQAEVGKEGYEGRLVQFWNEANGVEAPVTATESTKAVPPTPEANPEEVTPPPPAKVVGWSISKPEIEMAWGKGTPVEINNSKYSVHRMNYGEYFLEPINAPSTEKDFAKGTLWLKKTKDAYVVDVDISEANGTKIEEPITPAKKEPWEMTKEEFDRYWVETSKNEIKKSVDSKIDKAKQKIELLLFEIKDDPNNPANQRKIEEVGRLKSFISDQEKRLSVSINKPSSFMSAAQLRYHRGIDKALSEGKPVPAEVLKDYPELTKEQEAVDSEKLADEWLKKVTTGVEKIEIENSELLHKAMMYEGLKRRMDSGQITLEKFKEFQEKGIAATKEEYDRALEIRKKIEEIKRTPIGTPAESGGKKRPRRSPGSAQAMMAREEEPKYSAEQEDEEPAEEKNLVPLHNLSAENLRHVDKMGGIAVPSVGIAKKESPLTGFGEITLIGDTNLIDPRNKKNKIFNADIYSPRYPNINYELSSNELNRADSILKKESDDLKIRFISSIESHEVERKGMEAINKSEVLRLHYLRSIGRDVALPKKGFKPRFLKLNPKLQEFITTWGAAEDLKDNPAFLAEYKKAQEAEYNNAYSMKKKAGATDEQAKKFAGEITDGWYSENGNPSYRLVNTIYDEIKEKKDSGTVDLNKARNAINDEIAKVSNAYDEWVVKNFSGLIAKEKIFKGFTESGYRRYAPHTLENVVKELKRELRSGEGFNYGVGNLRALVAKRYNTIKQIQADRDKVLSRDEFEKIKTITDTEFEEILSEAQKVAENKEFGVLDRFTTVLADGIKRGNIKAELDEYGFPGMDIDRIHAFLNALKNMPTEYFEGKLQRAVDLKEFKGAIIKKSSPPYVREILEKNRIEYAEYNNDDDRAKVLSEFSEKLNDKFGNVLFSIKAKKPSNMPNRIEPAPINLTQGKKLGEMIGDVSRGVGTKIYYGKPGTGAPKGTIGVYKPGTTATIVRYAGDLDTTAHELAHSLDDKYGIVSPWSANRMKSPFDEELSKFWWHGSSSTTGPRNKLSYKRAEGVAEFIRAWLINPTEAVKQAPKFSAHLFNKLPKTVLDELAKFSNDMRIFAGASAHDQMMANVRWEPENTSLLDFISGGKSNPDDFGLTFWDKAKIQITDKLRGFEAAFDYLKGVKGVSDILPSNNPILLARLYSGVGAKTDQVLDTGMIDSELKKVTPGGIEWLMEPFDKMSLESEMKKAATLGIAQRTVEKIDRMKERAVAKLKEKAKTNLEIDLNRAIPALERYVESRRISGVGAGLYTDYAVAKRQIEEFKSNPALYDRLTEGLKRYRDWSDSLLKYLVDNGRLSQQAYDAIKANNEQYIAMNRIMEISPDEEIVPFRGKGKALGSIVDVVKKFKGSSREIQNPWVTLIQNTYKTIQEADRNRILQAFRDMMVGERGMYQGDVERLAQVGRIAQSGEKNTISIFVDGKREIWQLDQDVYKSLKGIVGENYRLPWLVTILPRIFRAGIVNFPPFMIRNMIRDAQTRAIISEFGTGVTDVFKKRPPMTVENFRLYGGDQFGHYMSSPQDYYRSMKAAIQNLSQDKNSVIVNLKNALQFYEDLSTSSERVNRIPEFETAFKYAKEKLKYDDYNAGLFAASKARGLLDFAVSGHFIQGMNQVVPFTNAGVQGLRVAFQAAQRDPKKFALKWSLVVLIPTLIERLMNMAKGDDDEYDQLPAYIKDMFFNFKIAPDLWLRIPKPFELGVLGSGVGRAFDWVMTGDDKAFEGYAGALARSFIPVDEAALAGPFKGIIESFANYDMFRNKNIVPPYEAKKELRFRMTERGSRLGQALQNVIGFANPFGKSIDSRKIDHLLRTQFGFMGSFASQASDIGRTDRGGLSLSTTGLVTQAPAYASRDAQWVFDTVGRYGLETSPEYQSLMKAMDVYFDADAGRKKDAAAARVREVAGVARDRLERRLPELEKILLKKKQRRLEKEKRAIPKPTPTPEPEEETEE